MKRLLCFVLSLIIVFTSLCISAFADLGPQSGLFVNYEHKHSLFTEFDEGLESAAYLAKVFSAATSGAAGNAVAECGGNLSRAEAISAAARIHSIYFLDSTEFPETKPWHKSYVDYALEYGLVLSEEGTLNAPVSRGELAYMLFRAFPRQKMPDISYILDGSIVDVDMGHPYAEAIYYFSRAGVFSDFDDKGNFYPNGTVPRGELYSIISRILIPSMRKGVELKGYVGSTAPLRQPADNEYFNDACIIGNSLVDGLSYYSGMDGMTYYSTTGMTVISAYSRYDFLSPIGTYETAVGAACKGNYSKVYIELGINEIGLEVQRFIAYYSRIIDQLKDSLPDAEIYILSLTPVNTGRDSGGVFTMASVNAYNEALKKLAIKNDCYYLDCVTTMVDETGFLNNADTWDGVHFYAHKYLQWEEIIRTHYA